MTSLIQRCIKKSIFGCCLSPTGSLRRISSPMNRSEDFPKNLVFEPPHFCQCLLDSMGRPGLIRKTLRMTRNLMQKFRSQGRFADQSGSPVTTHMDVTNEKWFQDPLSGSGDTAPCRKSHPAEFEAVLSFLRGRPDAHLRPDVQDLPGLGIIKATKHDDPFRHGAGLTRGA